MKIVEPSLMVHIAWASARRGPRTRGTPPRRSRTCPVCLARPRRKLSRADRRARWGSQELSGGYLAAPLGSRHYSSTNTWRILTACTTLETPTQHLLLAEVTVDPGLEGVHEKYVHRGCPPVELLRVGELALALQERAAVARGSSVIWRPSPRERLHDTCAPRSSGSTQASMP